MKYYYEKNLKVFKLEGKFHEKVFLYSGNFKNHIKMNHPEMTLNIIKEILEDPDCVYKASKHGRDTYYEKYYEGCIYRVVLSKKNKKKEKRRTYVVTGYKVYNVERLTIKHIYCIYDKSYITQYKENVEYLEENERDYFYELFEIAE